MYLGEFPWQVRVGESAEVTDYVSPPRVLSSEQTGNEVTWSMGEYLSGKDVWRAFRLPASAPTPSVSTKTSLRRSAETRNIWLAFGALLVLLVAMMIGFDMAARNEQVFTGYYKYNSNQRGEASFVTDVFEVKGHTSNVQLTTSTDLNNRWIYLNYALINEDTGQAFDFGREVSYYHGYDSDGSWSEGSANDRVPCPRCHPAATICGSNRKVIRIRDDLLHDHVKRDVPSTASMELLWVRYSCPRSCRLGVPEL